MTQERKDELDKFAETLIAKTQLEIEKFVTNTIGEPVSEKLLGEMKERGAEHNEKYDAEMAKFKEQVKTASTKSLKKVLTQITEPEHVDIVVADLQERVREDVADEATFKGALSLTHFQGLDDEDLIDAMREANDDGQYENMVRIILVVEDRFGLGYLLEKSVPEDTNEKLPAEHPVDGTIGENILFNEATKEQLTQILVQTQNTDVVKAVVKELDMRRAGEVLTYVGGLSLRLDEMLVEVKDLAEIAGDLSCEMQEVTS
ncbi:MAG: hypothetical protein ACTSWQ_07280 [Candidatus Thorarchaeota archaeon]